MISMLRGRVHSRDGDTVVIDVGGVGYLVSCVRATDLGDGEVTLLIEAKFSEDGYKLYGFRDEAERTWFRTLTGVKGVGGRIAVSLIGVLGAGALADAVEAGDQKALCRADGVGPTLARRLVAELSGRLPVPPAAAAPEVGEAAAALEGLGYGKSEAAKAAAAAAGELHAGATLEEIIRCALQRAAA